MVNIVVDREKCEGCGECISVCPAEVYELDDEGKSVPVRADDCEQCCSSVESFPTGAITVEGCE